MSVSKKRNKNFQIENRRLFGSKSDYTKGTDNHGVKWLTVNRTEKIWKKVNKNRKVLDYVLKRSLIYSAYKKACLVWKSVSIESVSQFTRKWLQPLRVKWLTVWIKQCPTNSFSHARFFQEIALILQSAWFISRKALQILKKYENVIQYVKWHEIASGVSWQITC